MCGFISLLDSGSKSSLASGSKELAMNYSRVGGAQLIQSHLNQPLWQPSHVGIGSVGKGDVEARKQQL